MTGVRVLVAVLLACSAAQSALAASAGARVDASEATHYAAVDGCARGTTDRLCIAYPDGCTDNDTCTTVVSVRKDPSSTDFLFDMSARHTGYVAVALAATQSMGSDSVVECIYEQRQRKVLVFQSLNTAKKPSNGKKGNTRLPDDEQKGVTLLRGKLEDGVISCSFSRNQTTTVNGTVYDLAAGDWVIQAVSGDRINNDTSVHHHTEWVVSSEKVKLITTIGLLDSYGERRDPPTLTSTPSPSASAAPTSTSPATVLAVLLALRGATALK